MKLIPIILLSLLIVPTLAYAESTSDLQTFFPDYTGDQYGYYEVFADQEVQMIWGAVGIEGIITYVQYLLTSTFLLVTNYYTEGMGLLFILLGLYLILSSAIVLRDDYNDDW